MLFKTHPARRAVIAVISTGAAAGALFGSGTPAAMAAPPPNCTAADLAGVAAGVSAATSVYLFTHPNVNAFFTSLEGAPRDQIRADVTQYLNDNPMIKAELTAVRQPLVDVKNRCGDNINNADNAGNAGNEVADEMAAMPQN